MREPDRQAQCRTWNADRAHQVTAGRARAKGFTHAHQVKAGNASFIAFSLRFRASHAGAQLFPRDAAKYLAPDDIRGVPSPFARMLYDAWCAGLPYGAEHWLLTPLEALDRPPLGGLFDVEPDEHLWTPREPGWSLCAECWMVALCPMCLPDWLDDRTLSRLSQRFCLAHGGRS